MKLRAIFLSALLVLSIVAGSIAFAGGAAAAPSGMVGVPGENIQDVRADGGELSADELTAYTDKHADTTEVSIVTDSQADEVGSGTPLPDVANEKVCENPGKASEKNPNADCEEDETPSLVLSDDEHHEGRTVAIEEAELREALGEIPGFITVKNSESGEEWKRATQVEDGWVKIEAPHFSDNAITWGGEVRIGDTFTNDSKVEYNLSDLDSASDPTINLTGKENTETDNHSFTEVEDGETLDVGIGGNLEANGSEITLTGEGQEGGSQKWTYDGHSDEVRGVAVDESTGTVYTASDDDEVHAIDPSDQSTKWTYDGHSDDVNDVAVDKSTGTVYTASDDEEVHAIDASDGSEEWTYGGGDGEVVGVAVDESTGTVYSASGEAQAIDAADGSKKWSYTGHDYNVEDIVVDESTGTVYTGSAEVHALDDSDGSKDWEYTDGGDTRGLGVDESTGTVYMSDGDGEVHALDDSNGSKEWGYMGHDEFTTVDAVTVDESTGTVYSGDEDGEVHAVNASDGSQKWTYTGHSNRVYGVAVDESTGTVYSGSSDDEVHAIEAYIPTPSDPSIDVNGDGTDEVSYSGELDGTHTETVDLGTDDESWTVSVSNAPIDVNASVEERTVTEDPGVELNGESVSHDGTLEDGETTTLTLDNSSLQEGTNTLTYSMANVSADAPAMQVDALYSHDSKDIQNVSYEGEKFSERYTLSKTYASDRRNPQLTIPFQGEVVEMRDLEYRRNDGSWQSMTDYEMDNTSVTANFPDVYANDTLKVRANGSKVVVEDGAIQVLKPTPEADDLNSKIEITDHGPDFSLHVDGIDDDRVIYPAEKSWSDANDSSVIDAEGSQKVRFPEAGPGSTATLQQAPLWAEPESDVAISVESASEPRFQVGPGESEGDMVTLEYADATSGETYELRRVDGDYDRQVDTDTAESPVYLETLDDTATYIIQIAEESSVQEPVGPVETEQSGTDAFMILLAIVAALGGLLLVVRSVGGTRIGRGGSTSLSLPVIDRSLSLPSLPTIESTGSRTGDSTSRTVIIGGLVIIGIVALEFATPESLLVILPEIVASSTAALSELLSIGAGIGALLGIWYLDQRTSESIPTWLMGVAAVVTVVYILETLQPGVLLGPASSGFETISPLFWIVLLGGGSYLIYGYIQTRRSPDTEVSLELRGEDK